MSSSFKRVVRERRSASKLRFESCPVSSIPLPWPASRSRPAEPGSAGRLAPLAARSRAGPCQARLRRQIARQRRARKPGRIALGNGLPDAALLAREIERPSDRKRFCHARFRGAITDHDIHLVRLPGEKDGRGSASPREAVKARSMNGH